MDDFDVLLDRLLNGNSGQSQIITGLRGVGKTVLLNRFADMAQSKHWVAAEAEIDNQTRFAPLMTRLARRALYSIDVPARWGERARKAAASLRSFKLTFDATGNLGIEPTIEPAVGRADSGHLGDDLTDLFVDLGYAAQERGKGVVFLIDEIQFLDHDELESLIVALHKTSQKLLPIALAAAGLPQIPKLTGEAKSYAERLFTFPKIDRLPAEAARTALVTPARVLDADFDEAAVQAALDFSEGYPYFLQEVGSMAWDVATGPLITSADLTQAIPLVTAKLDDNFFHVRVSRCTDLELRYLRAMAELPEGERRSGDIAVRLGYSSSQQIAPTRSALITKGLVYTPQHGTAEFTVPQFDKYMKRSFDLVPQGRPATR